jgi:regulator of sigma E protease
MSTVFAFVFAICLLIAVHEYGHYRAAVASGVPVLKFSIGFGPKLICWQSAKTDTEFTLNALPLGGYVRMLDEREGGVPADQVHKAFNRQSVRVRAFIVAAGPLANLVFAVFLYASVNWYGVEQVQPLLGKPFAGSIAERAGFIGRERVTGVGFDSQEIQPVQSFEQLQWFLTQGAVGKQSMFLEVVTDGTHDGLRKRLNLNLQQIDSNNIDVGLFQAIGLTSPFSVARIGAVSSGGAADAAGLRDGDVVEQVDGQSIADAAELRDLIRRTGQDGKVSKAQVWKVQRNGVRLDVTVVPRVVVEKQVSIGRVGAYIGAPPAMVTVQYGFWDGLSEAIDKVWAVSSMTLQVMGKILTGGAALKNISGPLSIADYAGKSASIGIAQYAIFLALISVSLGVLNLLPVPVLDGGHLMYYLWEALSGSPVSEPWAERFQKVGFAVLLMMMSLALFNDVARMLE